MTVVAIILAVLFTAWICFSAWLATSGIAADWVGAVLDELARLRREGERR